MPMKVSHASPPMPRVSSLAILCSATPRSTAGCGASSRVLPMHSYIAPSINRNANVLSPTKHWSCDSRYATAGSGERAVQISATRDGVQLKSGSAASADHLSGGPIESLRLNPKPPCHTGRHAPV